MNKTVFLFLYLLLFLQYSNAQNVVCGHDLVMAKMNKIYPAYQKDLDRSFNEAKEYSKNLRYPNTTLTIPVVVHLVWKEEEEKIDSSFILSQIDVLNEDFQRLNEDADNVRAIFDDVVGDPMIRFDLKEIKIVQTDTIFEVNILANELPDYIKVTGQGGSDAVDPSRNLNIWICNLQPIFFGGVFAGQLLGYAYPPNDLSNWPEGVEFPEGALEGIVLDYRTVGKNSPFLIPIGGGVELQLVKGRTATHEIGHYLGLRHTWGDGQFGSSCNEDDGIADTPNSGMQTIFNCDTLQNSCISAVDDLPDMIENFMDSADESCQNSFTQGQINLMRGVLELQRCGLVEVCDDVATTQLIQTPVDIFPNPSSAIFYIQSENFGLSNFDFIIYNSSGQAFPIQIKNQAIDLKRFPSGIYYLTGSNKTHWIQKRLIKM